MSETTEPTVTAHLTVKGGVDALKFYERAFGAEVLSQDMDEDGRRVMHATLDVFGTMIMLSDEFPEHDTDTKPPSAVGTTTVTLNVSFEDPADVDAAIKTAVSAGCTVTMPVMDMEWGLRYGRLKDRFGHVWAFGAPLPEV